MNGVVETANKNIKRILRKMIDNYKHWQKKVPFALLGYRTTIRASTRATPDFLVYGTEVMIPTEVEIPSLRIIQEAKLSDLLTNEGSDKFLANRIIVSATKLP